MLSPALHVQDMDALPDDLVLRILERCTSGRFSLELALYQVRLTGSVDPHWIRPLLHVAAKCPAVRQRLSQSLRHVQLGCARSTELLRAVGPKLTELQSLELLDGSKLAGSLLASLPTSLKKIGPLGYMTKSAEFYTGSLLRLTALEDLELSSSSFTERWTVGGELPRLRRLVCDGRLPWDLVRFAPRLEELETTGDLATQAPLPGSLTRVSFARGMAHGPPLSPLTHLGGLEDLTLPPAWTDAPGLAIILQQPGLLAPFTALTRLEIPGRLKAADLPQLVEALQGRPQALGICLRGCELQGPAPLEATAELFECLVELQDLVTDRADLLPWNSMTRLTRLTVKGEGGPWLENLSQLPRLVDLKLTLRRIDPDSAASLGNLTQCTYLSLTDVKGEAGMPCLQRLTRLRVANFSRARNRLLMDAPDSLTKLTWFASKHLDDMHVGQALQHLTALECLFICWPDEEDTACDLSPLSRLTSLELFKARCPLIRLGRMPLLQRLVLGAGCEDLDDGFLQQLTGSPALEVLELRTTVGLTPLTDASLAPLTDLCLLEKVVLPEDLGEITPDGLQPLLRLPMLESLVIRGMDPAVHKDQATPWGELKRKSKGLLRFHQS